MTVEHAFPPLFAVTNLAVTVTELPQTQGFVPVPGQTYLPNPVLHALLPVNINIQQDQPLEIKFDWVPGGAIITNWLTITPVIQNFISQHVTYEVEVYFEKMGTGNDRDFKGTVPFLPTATSIAVTLPTAAATRLDEGLYKVVAVFKLDVDIIWKGKFVVGFKDIGYVNVFKQEW